MCLFVKCALMVKVEKKFNRGAKLILADLLLSAMITQQGFLMERGRSVLLVEKIKSH